MDGRPSPSPQTAKTRADGAGATGGEERDEDPAEEPMANLERLVAEAMALAASNGGAGSVPGSAGATGPASSPGSASATGPASSPGSASVTGPELAELVNRFWRLVPDEELGSRTAAEMLGAVKAHLSLAQQRLPGELKLDIEHTDDATVLLIVTDDMPFLVDSLTAAITTAGLDLDLLAHPQVVLARATLGRLVRVRPEVEPDEAGEDELVESWMRIELGRIRDDVVLTALRNDLQRVLTDVREAVEDWSRMRTEALRIADELTTAVLPVPDKDITDSIALLRWLADDHFTFLGYREYQLVPGADGQQALEAVLGTGLGILRRDPTGPRSLGSMSPEAAERVLERRLLVITKANSRSTVHRSSYLDYIGFKIFDNDGNVVGERRFLGLFSSTAYLSSVRELPVVQRKVAEVVDRSGLSPRSHSGKALITILEDYPREELFQISTDDLFRTVMGVLRLTGRRQVRLFARKDQYGRFVSCLVYLPRDRYNTANRLKIQAILQKELHGIGVDYTTRVTDSTLARIHFIVRTDPASRLGEIDAEALSVQLADATRLWDEDFVHTLERRLGEEQAHTLVARYGHALPEIYKDSHTAHEAVQDLAMLELLEEPGQLVLHLFRRRKNDSDVRFKVFRYGEPMTLSNVLPVLHSLGARVHDERPYEVMRADATLHIYDFGLGLPDGCLDVTEVRAAAENAFSAAWRGESEVDGFNALVLRAGLTWRQVVLLRAYAKYLRQTGAVYSQEYIQTTLAGNPEIAAQLVRLFEIRLDPALEFSPPEREASAAALGEQVRHGLDAVASLDQDWILRSYLALVESTLRTSFFQRGGDGRPKSYVAFKLDPRNLPDLPEPRPMFEIFVYSPQFEAVHLRFGAVARGGLRWSDRPEDFRTEVLGLVKAQMVKNAVIVPVGAKGGFVLKRPAATSASSELASTVTVSNRGRDQLQAEATDRYRKFISALLDVTDNIAAGQVVPPAQVVRHDGDDPYLVVAADKGTATFSDLANEIAQQYGFWLGDAFASGGSAGYDHKKMGITARGVWESIKRHFREMNVDTQSQDFTATGIGDMSGDVFGNGMLRSEHIRLVAAFDHRHIFIDPSPDAAASFVERRRLFDAPRSSWDDYDRSVISAGGGVWPRTRKSIPISAQARAALGIENERISALTPPELIRAILAAPVDLLFNGGVGTYVKASTESHLDVGDKANDALRVNGEQIRAKVIGEGGNLGLTQRGRVEYALRGGTIDSHGRQAHLCTDFIDNSAGVDCSDHEVNIKILLGAAEADGDLTRTERDDLLEEMTDEVAELVLRDNYEQANTLAAARTQAAALLPVHRRMITEMDRAGQLDRHLEALPADAEFDTRSADDRSSGPGLTSPELAVLLAYTKIAAARSILESSLPDEEWTSPVLVEYFPTPLRKRFADRMPALRLRREIVTTRLVNEAVNRGGVSFLFRAVEETSAGLDDVVRAYVVVRDVFRLPALWRAIEDLDGRLATRAQTALVLLIRRLMDRAVRWLVSSRHAPIDVPTEIARLGPGVAELLPRLSELFHGREQQALRKQAAHLRAQGVPAELADWATRVQYSFGLLDIVEAAHTTGRDLDQVAAVYFLLSDEFRVDDLLSRISSLPRQDRWQTLARMALRYDLYAALAALTVEVLGVPPRRAMGPGEERAMGPGEKPAMEAAEEAAEQAAKEPTEADDLVRAWESANAASIDRVRRSITDFDESRADLASLSVLLRQIRTLVRHSAARAG